MKLPTTYKESYNAGFTMFEIVVMLAIITAISVVVIFSFSDLREGININKTAREIALALRQAQNFSLAVRSIDTPLGNTVPRTVGVQIVVGGSYFIFADLNVNGKFDALTDVKLTDSTPIPGGSIFGFEGCVPTPCPSIINVLFSSPEAAVTLTDNNGADIGDRVQIDLQSFTGLTKRNVSVRTSGQISIQ